MLSSLRSLGLMPENGEQRFMPMRVAGWALPTFVAAFAALQADTAAAEYRYLELMPPGSERSQVFDVNNRGQVAVNGWTASGGTRAFVWDNGSFAAVTGPADAASTSVIGLNDGGLVVGEYVLAPVDDMDPQVRGFVFDGAGYRTVSAPGASQTFLRGISPDGRWASGYSNANGNGAAFVVDLETGAFHDLARTTGSFSLAQGFSPTGQVVGYESNGGEAVGFVYDLASGVRSDNGWWGYTESAFRDIDSTGRMVGWVRWRDGMEGPIPGSGAIGTPDSYELISGPGARRTDLQGINEAGWVTGNYTFWDGEQQTWLGFVAMPVPEPATSVLFLLGGAALLRHARWSSARGRP